MLRLRVDHMIAAGALLAAGFFTAALWVRM